MSAWRAIVGRIWWHTEPCDERVCVYSLWGGIAGMGLCACLWVYFLDELSPLYAVGCSGRGDIGERGVLCWRGWPVTPTVCVKRLEAFHALVPPTSYLQL